MATSYQELMDKAKQMMAEAEKLRQKERQKAIEEIQKTMQRYELTLQDIAPPGVNVNRSASNRPPKYRGPRGELWAGGRGRKPDWVKKVLAEGRQLEEFEIR